ncbi:MAG: hypothetical protein KC434_16910 [Anaerolineales bacterium]|nr:hypothetical protein [Anaerolineales bacterium]
MNNQEPNSERDVIYFLAHYKIRLGLSVALIGAGLFGIISILLRHTLSITTGTGSFLALLLGILLLLDTLHSMLIISAEGIEYRRSGYTIFANWANIKGIEHKIRRRPEYVLVLEKPAIKANRINKQMLELTKASAIIPLNMFVINWHQKSIGNLIQCHAPQIKLPS